MGVVSFLWTETKPCFFCDFSFLQWPPHTLPFLPTAKVLRVSFLVSFFITLFSRVTLLWVLHRDTVSMWIHYMPPSAHFGNHVHLSDCLGSFTRSITMTSYSSIFQLQNRLAR